MQNHQGTETPKNKYPVSGILFWTYLHCYFIMHTLHKQRAGEKAKTAEGFALRNGKRRRSGACAGKCRKNLQKQQKMRESLLRTKLRTKLRTNRFCPDPVFGFFPPSDNSRRFDPSANLQASQEKHKKRIAIPEKCGIIGR